MQPRQSRSWLARSTGFLVYGLIVGSGLFALYQQQAIVDWFRLRNYAPPQPIAVLAEQTAMTDQARHLFYINHPELLDKATFRQECPDYGEKTIVIGCYLGGQRGIHLLAVSDERLEGVEQVTAAHEMLHAAYERLGSSEKEKINRLLSDYKANRLQDERIKAALKGYETSEPGEQNNEMHSIFGTEIARLPPELEAYYSKYFEPRAKVVTYAQQYQDAFTSRQTAIAEYDTDLARQSGRIRENTAALEKNGIEIERSRQRLDDDRQAGEIEAYNAGVQPFNDQVAAYNELLVETRQLIEQYNALIEKRNAIAAQTVALQQAIDSSSLPGRR